MGDEFRIFCYRIKEGQKEQIRESFSPAFLGVAEEELAFLAPVQVQGEAEFVEDTLVLHLHIETEATMPCAICNQKVEVKLEIPDFIHSVERSEIKGDVFDFTEVLREAILLELPYRAECNLNNCPERESISKYISRS